MLKLGKLKIHWSFFFFLIPIAALGQIKLFFFLLSATTLHELSHILAARSLRLHVECLIITAIGETAYIEGFDALPVHKKCVILLAGPLANIISTIIIFSFFSNQNANLITFAHANIAIGIFNLLPIYPFDGGKLALIFIGNRLGIKKSIKCVKHLTKIGICLLLFFGFMQLVLFPFNISLIGICAFLISIFEREKNTLAFSYYKCMLYKFGRLKSGFTAKPSIFSADTLAEEVERTFTWDYFHIIYVTEGDRVIAILTEKQIFEAEIKHFGSGTKLLDIISNDDIINLS